MLTLEEAPYFCWMQTAVPQMVSMDSTVGMASLPLGNGGTLNPSLVLLRPWQGGGMAPYFRKVHVKVWPHLYHKRDGGLITGQIPTWPFLGKSESHRYFFCRVWMEYNTYYVKVSCLFSAASFLVLWLCLFVCFWCAGGR